MSAIENYSDNIRRICFVYLKNPADTEDVFQDVFLKYAESRQCFESEDHVKAWLLRVCINRCKDILKRSSRKNIPLDELYQLSAQADAGTRETLEAVLALPQNYRAVIYLHYYEGYTAPEIAKILRKNPNTVYTWLGRARDELRNKLGGTLGE